MLSMIFFFTHSDICQLFSPNPKYFNCFEDKTEKILLTNNNTSPSFHDTCHREANGLVQPVNKNVEETRLEIFLGHSIKEKWALHCIGKPSENYSHYCFFFLQNSVNAKSFLSLSSNDICVYEKDFC
jgi:hypothetical protein